MELNQTELDEAVIVAVAQSDEPETQEDRLNRLKIAARARTMAAVVEASEQPACR